MTVNEINARIEQANKNAKKLNNDRQMKMGQRDALTKQRDSAIAEYQKKYGVVLTSENIASELEKVTIEKEKEVADIESLITYISNGDYAAADKLSNKINGIEEVVEEPVAEAELEIPSQPVVKAEEPSTVNVDLDMPPTFDDMDLDIPDMIEDVEDDEEEELPLVKEEPKVEVKPEVKPELGIPAPPSLNLGDLDDMDLDFDLDLPEPPKAKTGSAGATKKSNFGSILNGSEFSPTGGNL